MVGFTIYTTPHTQSTFRLNRTVETNNTRHTRYGWPTNINKRQLSAIYHSPFALWVVLCCMQRVHAPSLSTHLNIHSCLIIGLIVLTLCIRCVHLYPYAYVRMWDFLCAPTAHTHATWQHPRHTMDKQECICIIRYTKKPLRLFFPISSWKQNIHAIICSHWQRVRCVFV